jgi:U3 small nucleolar RNA-associated protein 12
MKFQEVTSLEGHQGEVWSLAVGKYGNILVSAGQDKSIRIWRKTDEQFVLSEEKGEQLEKLYDQMASDSWNIQTIGSQADGNVINNEEDNEPATRATNESVKAGELLAEALIVWKQEASDMKVYLEVFLEKKILMNSCAEIIQIWPNPHEIHS